MRKEIEKLLASNLTSNKIATGAEVTPAKIYRLRSGETKLDNITLAIAEKLYNYYKEIDNMNRTEMIYKEAKNHLAYSDDEGSMYVKLYDDLESFLEAKDWDEDDLVEEFDFMQSGIEYGVPVVAYEGEAAGLINIAYIDDETDSEEVIATLEGMI